MNFTQKIRLGRTGLYSGRLGISSSYGAPAEAFEEAFEHGCNYFTWGTFILGRSKEMKKAVHNIVHKGQRDNLIIAIYSYSHSGLLTEIAIHKGLKKLGIDYADVMILGYYPRQPSRRIIDGALNLKEKGLIHHLALSGHNRKLFPELQKEGIVDIFHVRYNAVNRGAENDIFPYLQKENRPGIISFTATRWGQLLKQKKMPPGLQAPSAADCYRYVLSNPSVDVCMVGTRNIDMMRENLAVLEQGPMSEEELIRMRKIGDYIYKA
ncbi:MAG: hypothetical protein AMS27_11900 [Bacteroides sp. SM23_62_1]|nr:MAG: hypothetical protein AMS27_11900 [Bacteroides sp. SM23_62_1]